MSLATSSIAQLYYPGEPPIFAGNGFFVETAEHPEGVCVTCAHLFDEHPGRASERHKIIVNGHESRLLYSAWEEHEVDVALVEIPEGAREDQSVVFQKLGVSDETAGAVFYICSWSPEDGGSRIFVKVWGARLERQEFSAGSGGKTHFRWRLRNDRPDAEAEVKHSTKNFKKGWSGAPVFNVRSQLEDHRVIGIFSSVEKSDPESGSVVTGARCISLATLDFLRPAEWQEGEGVVVEKRDEPTFFRRLFSAFYPQAPAPAENPPGVIVFERPGLSSEINEANVYRQRASEILRTLQYVLVPEPPSLYDEHFG